MSPALLPWLLLAASVPHGPVAEPEPREPEPFDREPILATGAAGRLVVGVDRGAEPARFQRMLDERVRYDAHFDAGGDHAPASMNVLVAEGLAWASPRRRDPAPMAGASKRRAKRKAQGKARKANRGKR